MRVLVAPDKFRGTLTARQAAEAIETGWRRSRADDRLDLLPMADGGEGTLETLVDAQGGRTEAVRVSGPLGDPVDAPLGLIDDDRGRTAVIEMARASGLMLLADARLDPRRTTTFGTGELIRAALDAGARRVLVCIGGSATNDGGAGMAQALGVRLLDAEGQDVDPGGGSLARLSRIDASAMDVRIRTTTIVGACDVDNPLTGAQGASVVFGPQKGATPEDVHVLDLALGHLAAVSARDLGADLAHEPGAGAAGGLGFGLMLFCGARLRPGVDVVMEASGFESRAGNADLLVTGEGALDATSLRGKVVGGVLGMGELLGRPVAVVAGRADVRPPAADVSTLVDLVGPELALGDARRSLEAAAQSLAERAGDLAPERA